MKLSFAWWNTSLSPASHRDKSSAAEQSVASEVIRVLAEELDLDVICLGEVSEQDIAEQQSHWEALGYTVHSGVSSAGRTVFDTCVLYKPTKLFFLDSKNKISRRGTSTLKVAQRIDFGVCDNESVIHLFVSHWPSRLWCHENHADRDVLGLRLREAVEDIQSSSSLAHIVLLGDFNDEPHDKSLSEHLMATRDRTLASRKSDLLYNPFWRHMGPFHPFNQNAANNTYSGSYYYKSGKINKWQTFDQIIFSHSFLGKSQWHLREDMVCVIDIKRYTQLVYDSTMSFDHLPVMGTIEKVG